MCDYNVVNFCLLITNYLIVVECRSGVDLSVTTTKNDWQCLTSDFNVSFAIIRIYRSVGLIDTEAANSIINAYSSNLKNIDVYIFPCVSTSSYSISNNITCASPDSQVIQTLQYLKENDISINKGYNSNNNNNDIHSKASINRIWIDIEDEVPSKYYDSNIDINQDFIASIVNTLEIFKVPIGIYTTKTYWNNIMGGISDFSEYPLWYPRYDGVDNMDFFVPFSGWDYATIKQTNGNINFCNITQVDSDYMQDS